MAKSMRSSADATSSAKARLRIRKRFLPLHTALPFIRWLSVTTLVVCLAWGGIRFLTRPLTAGALEFELHQFGSETGAKGVQGIQTFDMDGDNDADIITAGLDGIKVYENEGEFGFNTHIVDTKKGERVQVVDLDDDDTRDLLVTLRGEDESVMWYRNNGDIDFTPHTLSSSGDQAVAYADDIDGDGRTDIATTIRTPGETRVLSRWMNNGNSTFTETVLDSDSKATTVTIGDTDGNNYPDIVTGGTGGLQRWRTNNGVSWARDDIDDANKNGTHIVVADPGDGRTFIVTGDTSTNIVAIYRSRENDMYGRMVLGGDSTDATTVHPTDFDNDGDLDVLAAGQDDNMVVWYDNEGDDMFTRRVLATNLQSVFGVATADFDNDGDNDFVSSDHFRGPISVYERLRVKPEATKPTNVQQSTTGKGLVTFESTISDGDFDATRLRVQYSLDGDHWYKPWLTKVTADNGSVDLKNSNGYQVGTTNPVDTDTNTNVKLTFTWDTKSIQNTGGALSGEETTVQVRIIPRDDKAIGTASISSKFTVDSKGPVGLANLKISSITEDEAILTWTAPKDASTFSYEIFFGTDSKAVLDQTSDSWDSDDDDTLSDIESTSTTITGLEANKNYTFKIIATDAFGNSSAAPSVRGLSTTVVIATPTPITTTVPSTTPLPSTTAAPFTTPSVSLTTPTPITSTTPLPTVTPTPIPTPLPSPSQVPSTLDDNQAPVADAGADQVVNPSALVILDASASFDQDKDSLSYSWRQISGAKVDLISDRTATPSFSAGGENETYIFVVTVRDTNGATATENVTVATRALPQDDTLATVRPVAPDPDAPAPPEPVPPIVSALLHPADLILFGLSLFSTLLLLFERIMHAIGRGKKGKDVVTALPKDAQPQGRVLHYKTGDPIVGAQVMVYGADGKLRATERTNAQGVFPTFFPAGQYTLGVDMQGFTFAPTAARALTPASGILYTGGTLTVRNANQPITLIIPMKPTATEVSSSRVRLLHFWQSLQHLGRVLSWPIFLSGAMLNTVLIFIAPRPLYLILEVIYIVLVITKIALEVHIRPAYGQVRDAITHVPLDLAVVRLLEQGTNRLVMTRVTNNQGKFFALPPSGSYTVTISKPGYATFSKQDIEIKSEHDTTLQMMADLMPIAPQPGGLAQARAAVL